MSRADPVGARVEPAPAAVSWARAALTTLTTLFALIVSFFYVPHWILTQLSVPARSGRVWLATGWMALAFALACYAALRSTQTATNTSASTG